MTTALSRATTFGEKKGDPLPVRFTDAQKAFIKGMVSFNGMESDSEYLRFLIDREISSTANSLKLMADALGVKVSTENSVFSVSNKMDEAK